MYIHIYIYVGIKCNDDDVYLNRLQLGVLQNIFSICVDVKHLHSALERQSPKYKNLIHFDVNLSDFLVWWDQI
jgi:hypothetical protein